MTMPFDVSTPDKVLELWRKLPDDDKEIVIVHLLRDTEMGQRIAEGGFLPFIPHHMWKSGKRLRTDKR
jgi:hypothetical protein